MKAQKNDMQEIYTLLYFFTNPTKIYKCIKKVYKLCESERFICLGMMSSGADDSVW